VQRRNARASANGKLADAWATEAVTEEPYPV
jgi:hypothetical protein